MARSFAVLGASGLVGGLLLPLLAEDPAYAHGVVLSRRALGLERGKIREVTVDFDRPETFRPYVAVDDVFCCLGTTMKKAGSQAAFRKVDCDIPLAVAREARAAGANQYLIVTAVGADPKSGVFYNRVKGDVEAALLALDFPRGTKILHPSLIMGDRAERRPMERATMALMASTRPLFVGGLERYKAIAAVDVARAMQRAASAEGTQVYEGRALFALASGASSESSQTRSG